jgi:hypothetical protein
MGGVGLGRDSTTATGTLIEIAVSGREEVDIMGGRGRFQEKEIGVHRFMG